MSPAKQKPAAAAQAPEALSTRVKALATITTTTKLLGLGLLVTEAVLTAMAVVATGRDRTLLIAGVLASMILIIVASLFLESKRTDVERLKIEVGARPAEGAGATPAPSYKYDVFIAALMASTSDDKQYDEARQKVMLVKETLEKECGWEVFFAGEHLKTRAQFDEADSAVSDNLEHLKASRRFMLVYPDNTKSSVLVEAGMAMALGRDAAYFVRDPKDLPWLLRKANQVHAAGFPRVKIHEDCGSYDAILEKIKLHREKLFD